MKGQRPRKKVVLFLVEGQSEINALKPVFSALYDSIDPDIEVFFPTIVEDGRERRGDITSKYGITPDVLVGCINKLFLETFFDEKKLYPKDITEIIQIVDLDGAYIPDACVTYGVNPEGEEKPYYSDGGILTTNVENVVARNRRKQKNLDYLCTMSQIKIKSKSIKYSVYYFSCNLDHFLYGERNLPAREKARRAEEYALQYTYDPQAFAAHIQATPGALAQMGYEESWQFIRENNNSLQRYSNIGVLLTRLMNEAGPA